jgi:hypothetical protein
VPFVNNQPRNLHCRFESLFIFGLIRLFIISSESNSISGIDGCTTGFLLPILCFCFPEMLVDTAVNSLSEFLVYKPSLAHTKILAQIQNQEFQDLLVNYQRAKRSFLVKHPASNFLLVANAFSLRSVLSRFSSAAS